MEHLIVEKKDRIGSLILNRPEKRNALSPQLVEELTESFNSFSHDDEVKVILLKGNGKVFCAGADLKYLQQLQINNYKENLEDSQSLKNLFYHIYACQKPVIAQVHGHAIAGGAGLVSVCDFVFSAPDSKFGFTEVRIGFIPAIVSVFLLKRIGEGRTRELLLSGNLYSADKMQQIGFVNDVIEKDLLENFCYNFAQELIKNNSGISMNETKKLLIQSTGLPLKEALEMTAEANARFRGTEDCKRGIQAFIDKTSIEW